MAAALNLTTYQQQRYINLIISSATLPVNECAVDSNPPLSPPAIRRHLGNTNPVYKKDANRDGGFFFSLSRCTDSSYQGTREGFVFTVESTQNRRTLLGGRFKWRAA